MLLDSNLIIYAAQSGYDDLRDWMSQYPICENRPREFTIAAGEDGN